MGIYIYMSVTLLRMRRIIIIILLVRAMGRHGFPGIFPAKVWHAAAFSCNGSAQASALMRISSIYIYIYNRYTHIHIGTHTPHIIAS